MADVQNELTDSDLSQLEELCNSLRCETNPPDNLPEKKKLYLLLQKSNLTPRRVLNGLVADVWDDFREPNYPRASRFLFLNGIPTTEYKGTYAFRFESNVEAQKFESVIYNLNSREAMGRSIMGSLMLSFSFPARTPKEMIFSVLGNLSLTGGFYLLRNRAFHRFREEYLPRANFHSLQNYDSNVINEVLKLDYYVR